MRVILNGVVNLLDSGHNPPSEFCNRDSLRNASIRSSARLRYIRCGDDRPLRPSTQARSVPVRSVCAQFARGMPEISVHDAEAFDFLRGQGTSTAIAVSLPSLFEKNKALTSWST